MQNLKKGSLSVMFVPFLQNRKLKIIVFLSVLATVIHQFKICKLSNINVPRVITTQNRKKLPHSEW